MDAKQMLEAGADITLAYTKHEVPDTTISASTSETEMQGARDAMHHLLYALVNSKAMEGAAPGSVMKAPLQNADITRIALTGTGALATALVVFSEIRHRARKKAWKAAHSP